MRLLWAHDLPDGRRIEYRLPRWYPWALRLLGLLTTARGVPAGPAQVERLRAACLKVRVLPDGRWMRWREFGGGAT